MHGLQTLKRLNAQRVEELQKLRKQDRDAEAQRQREIAKLEKEKDDRDEALARTHYKDRSGAWVRKQDHQKEKEGLEYDFVAALRALADVHLQVKDSLVVDNLIKEAIFKVEEAYFRTC